MCPEDSNQPGHSPIFPHADSEDSEQADLSLRWAHKSLCWFCWFCHAVALLYNLSRLKWTWGFLLEDVWPHNKTGSPLEWRGRVCQTTAELGSSRRPASTTKYLDRQKIANIYTWQVATDHLDEPVWTNWLHTPMNVNWSRNVFVKRRHALSTVLTGQRNARLTSSHGDSCLTLWPNKTVNNFSAPRILHNLHRATQK